ncbi:unnamed protein product [Alternaria alternata]|jgi:hypothetical protein
MSSAPSGAEGPQTPEDVARDQPEPEIDELGRVRVANKYATIITSRQAYGQLLSPGQRSRMELWVERLPYDWHFEDANTACLIAVTVYKDWLDWSESKAFSWLDKLTKFERRFRIAGVAYHKIPYALRHASTVTNSYRINPVILVRLSQIFETDRPRAQQSFFHPWIEISNAAKEVLGKLIANKNNPEDIDRLRILESGSEVALSLLANSLPNLESALAWVEEQVADVADRSDIDGSDNLAAKHSREGGLFRRWIQTFPEIELGTVQSQSEFTEGFVDAVSGDEDIVEYRY